MINRKAAGDSRYALSGKDGALYDEDGVLIATVETYAANVNVTNGKYAPLGDAQGHEYNLSFDVTLTFTQLVVEDDRFFQEFVEALEKQEMPRWNFAGVIKGKNGTEERIVYRDCVPSGQVDLQNVTVGDIVKRNWNLFVNSPPKLQKMLSID